MYLEELRTLLARHARPDWTTAIDGVLISKVDRPRIRRSPRCPAQCYAVIAQGAKRLALGDRVLRVRRRAVPGRHRSTCPSPGSSPRPTPSIRR
ncbi:hypothetical protein ACRAWF_24995 [Streptomyces sp. L7]